MSIPNHSRVFSKEHTFPGESKFRSIVSVLSDGIVMTDEQGFIVEWNKGQEEISGIRKADVAGRALWDVQFELLAQEEQTQENYDLLKDLARQLINTGQSSHSDQAFESRIRRPDGAHLTIETITYAMQTDQGNVAVCISRDITQKKQADWQLSMQSTVLESAANGIAITNRNGEIVWINPAFTQLTGYSMAEVQGKTFRILKSGMQKPETYKMLWDTISAGKVWQGELINRKKDGSLYTEEQTITPIRDDNGEISHFIAIIQDVTLRKAAESEIDRLAAVVEQVNEGVLITSLEKNILYVNPFYEKLTGYSREELIGKNHKLLRADPNFDTQIWETASQGKEWKGSVVNQRKDGSQYYEEMSVFPIKNNNGDTINIAALGRDVTARIETENQVHLQLRRLAALRSIDLAITSSLDVRVVLNVLLDQVVNQLDVDAAVLLLLNSNTEMLEYAGGRGFRRNTMHQSLLRIGQGLPGQIAAERRSVNIPNFIEYQDQFIRAPLIDGEDFVAYFGVPLIAKGQVKGVLEIFNRSPLEPDMEWLNFLDTLAGQAAIAIDNANLFSDLQKSNEELAQAYITTLEGWVRTLGLRDDETEDHAHRVTTMTLKLAQAVGIVGPDLVHVKRGALLHDIGKMAVPDHILLKRGPLNEDEWHIMQQHPVNAYELLLPISYLRPALDIPYCHHEKWDGSGYPRGLAGEEIPIAARMFAVADVWDALSSDRPYRKAWNKDMVAEYVLSESGKHFDPEVVKAFFNAGLNKNGYVS